MPNAYVMASTELDIDIFSCVLQGIIVEKEKLKRFGVQQGGECVI